jgi:hypothetical protein
VVTTGTVTSAAENVRARVRQLPLRASPNPRVGVVVTWIVGVALVAAAAVIAVVQIGGRALRVEPYFDEMWRIDLIRSAHPYDHPFMGVTPVAPGWVYLFRVLAPVLTDDAGSFRVASILVWSTAIGSLFVLLRELGRPRRPSRGASLVTGATAAAAALSLTVLPFVTSFTSYFNQYLFEVAYGAALVACCALVGRRRWAFATFLLLAAGAPVFVLSPLALLPGTFAAVLWWAWRDDVARRGPRLVAVVSSGAVAGLAAIVVYTTLYARLADQGLANAWRLEALRGAEGDPLLVGRTLDLLRDGVLGSALAPGGAWWVIGAVVLVAAFVTGTVTACRRWPWFGVLLVSGWASTLLAGAATDGPVTPVRVTLGFWFLVYVTIAFGFFRGVAFLVAALHAPVVAQLAVLGVVLAAVVVASWPPAPVTTGNTFAQGLLHDLDVVVDSPTRDNLVLTYHYMANPYTHDRLVNRRPRDRAYVVVGQSGPNDERLFEPAHVDALLRRSLPDGGTLWCVIPYASGPVDGGRACPTPPELRQIVRSPGHMANVVGYEVPPQR